MLAPLFFVSLYLCNGRRSRGPFPLWIWDKREAVMAARGQGEQRWSGSLMAVINDNRPEESWDTGATYIIPSHQSMHLRGLFSANQQREKNKERNKHKNHLVRSQSACRREASRAIRYGSLRWWRSREMTWRRYDWRGDGCVRVGVCDHSCFSWTEYFQRLSHISKV